MKYFLLALVSGLINFHNSDLRLHKNSFISTAPSKKVKSIGSEYFPIDLKKKLIYNSSFGDLELKVTEEKNIHLFSYESDKFKYKQRLFINNKGLFIVETYQKIKLLLFITKEGNYIYDKPLLRIPFPVEIGQDWSWNGIEFVNDETRTVKLNGKASGFETITTAAGKFEALKVETTLQTSSGSKNVMTEWYAKSLGLVKMHISIEGGGIMGFVRDVLGYKAIDFELKEIKG